MSYTTGRRSAVIALAAMLLSGGVAVAQDPVELTVTVLGTGTTPTALQAVADAVERRQPRHPGPRRATSGRQYLAGGRAQHGVRGRRRARPLVVVVHAGPELAGHERDRHARAAR